MNRRLHPLFDDEGAIGAESGVEVTPAAEVSNETVVETGVEKEVVAEPNNFEKAFAKRLAAKEAEWKAAEQEKYKDYDTHLQLSEYLQKINESDALTLRERIEMEKLQERAEQANVPPEVIKRLDELEAKAAEGDALKQQQQQQQAEANYFTALDTFLKDKGVEAAALNQFMIDNKMTYNPESMETSFNIALKAMKADELQKKLEEKETETISRYLASKNAPNVPGTPGAAGTQAVDTSKMSWKEITKHAAGRFEANKQPQ